MIDFTDEVTTDSRRLGGQVLESYKRQTVGLGRTASKIHEHLYSRH